MYSITDHKPKQCWEGHVIARKQLESDLLTAALRAVGEVFRFPQDVEILIVGGGALMLTGLVPAGRTTIDCDVMLCAPSSAGHTLEQAGAAVAPRFGLRADWLTTEAGYLASLIPEGWRDRRVLVLERGSLKVYAAGRLDLIALKLIAGRPQDRQDLAALAPTPADGSFLRAHLASLRVRGTSPAQVAAAIDLLEALEGAAP